MNENWQGELKYSEKTHPSATWSTTNLIIWPEMKRVLGEWESRI